MEFLIRPPDGELGAAHLPDLPPLPTEAAPNLLRDAVACGQNSVRTTTICHYTERDPRNHGPQCPLTLKCTHLADAMVREAAEIVGTALEG